MDEAAKQLLVQGGLASIAGAALWFAWFKDKQTTAERERHSAELRELHASHNSEREEWQHRYVTKAETWSDKFHDLARSMYQVIEALKRGG